MISTSGILSTGEKKWTPTKSSGRPTPRASALIGKVEVLDPSTASVPTACSISAKTLALSPAFSKTASITTSTPARSAASAVGRIRPSRASLSCRLVFPRATAFASSRSA